MPRPRRLHARYTKRCPACNQCLIKPDSKASSARFKLRLLAVYAARSAVSCTGRRLIVAFRHYVPKLTLVGSPSLHAHRPASVLLHVRNRTGRAVGIRFLAPAMDSGVAESSASAPWLRWQTDMAAVELPRCTVTVPTYNEFGEYGEAPSDEAHTDAIVLRHENTVILRARVTPLRITQPVQVRRDAGASCRPWPRDTSPRDAAQIDCQMLVEWATGDAASAEPSMRLRVTMVLGRALAP